MRHGPIARLAVIVFFWTVSAAGLAQSITADRGPIGSLLRKWADEGTAAGNAGDFYDNRDRGHSQLDTSPWPQLGRTSYTPEDRKANRDWAAQFAVRPEVVFGNSSTSSSATLSGSNTRLLYTSRANLDVLYDQYRHNNLYIYPAHHDHSPGHNGLDGAMYGDLIPANTPYLITSQGSSGSDQPFMRAMPCALAAFRPEVKAKLISSRMLMPTLQMIFRMSNKQVAAESDYLTGKAHPTVFDGSQVDALKMATLAHSIDVGHIPPLVQLELVGVEDAQAGRDYFDPFPSEALGTTPCAIARTFRAATPTRRMIVSAASSIDVNNLPLTYHWVVLRGDPSKVRITPTSSGSQAEIVISYHDRAPVAGGAALESNRVDIGVFAYNGRYYSAPAFITSYTLDSEARTYDDAGRLLEIGYGMGDSLLSIRDWAAYFQALKTNSSSLALDLLHEGLSAEEMSAIRAIGDQYLAGRESLKVLEQQLKDANAASEKLPADKRKEIDQDLKSARETIDLANKSREAYVTAKQPGLSQPLQSLLRPRLNALLADPLLYPRHAASFGLLTPAAEQQRKRLLAYGIITESAAQPFVLAPLLPGSTPPEQRLTRYQRTMVGRFNGDLLANLIPGARHEFRPNLVDFRLTSPKTWRDVYRYDADGRLIGWTRYDAQAISEFTANGDLVVTRDALGRPLVGRAVLYERRTPASFDPRSGPDQTPVTFSPGNRYVHYVYSGDGDTIGRIGRIEERVR